MKNALTWGKPVAIIPIDFQVAQFKTGPAGFDVSYLIDLAKKNALLFEINSKLPIPGDSGIKYVNIPVHSASYYYLEDDGLQQFSVAAEAILNGQAAHLLFTLASGDTTWNVISLNQG